MRFLFLTQYFPPEVGAAQVRLDSLTSALAALGHDVHVITALPNYPTGRVFADYRGGNGRREVRKGVSVRRTWIFPVKSGGLKRLLSYLSFQSSSTLAVLADCWRRKPDYLFIESPPLFLGATGMLARAMFGTRVVFNVADLWPDVAAEIGVIRRDGLFFKASSFLERQIYRISTVVSYAVVFIGEALIAKGIPKGKLAFLPNGVDVELFSPDHLIEPDNPVLRRLDVYANKKIVLYAGTHGKVHNLTVAIDAAKLLENRDDIVFLFVGDGTEKSSVVSYAQSRAARNVVFWDPVPLREVADLLACSTLALSIATVSARPAKIFPAMASAKPIVYAGAGEGAALIRENGAGVVVGADDAEDIAAAILALVDDPKRAAALGRAGRELAVRDFDWRSIATRWLDELESSTREPAE